MKNIEVTGDEFFVDWLFDHSRSRNCVVKIDAELLWDLEGEV